MRFPDWWWMQNNEEYFTFLLLYISGNARFPARNLFDSSLFPPPFIMEEFCFDGLILVSADQVQTPEFSKCRDGEQLQTRTAHQWATCILRELRPQDSSITYLYTTESLISYVVGIFVEAEWDWISWYCSPNRLNWVDVDTFPALIGRTKVFGKRPASAWERAFVVTI